MCTATWRRSSRTNDRCERTEPSAIGAIESRRHRAADLGVEPGGGLQDAQRPFETHLASGQRLQQRSGATLLVEGQRQPSRDLAFRQPGRQSHLVHGRGRRLRDHGRVGQHTVVVHRDCVGLLLHHHADRLVQPAQRGQTLASAHALTDSTASMTRSSSSTHACARPVTGRSWNDASTAAQRARSAGVASDSSSGGITLRPSASHASTMPPPVELMYESYQDIGAPSTPSTTKTIDKQRDSPRSPSRGRPPTRPPRLGAWTTDRSCSSGCSRRPRAAELDHVLLLAEIAEVSGLDLVTIQDHPYQSRHADAWTLLSVIAARSASLRVGAQRREPAAAPAGRPGQERRDAGPRDRRPGRPRPGRRRLLGPDRGGRRHPAHRAAERRRAQRGDRGHPRRLAPGRQGRPRRRRAPSRRRTAPRSGAGAPGRDLGRRLQAPDAEAHRPVCRRLAPEHGLRRARRPRRR